MVSANPLEALRFVEHFLSTWEANLKRTNLAYVHAGCLCRHKYSIEENKEHFKELKNSFDDLLQYCSDSRGNIIEADNRLKEARYLEERLNTRYEKEIGKLRVQLRNISLQRQGRDRFVKHVRKAFKRHDASSLARLTAGFGANYRFQLEERHAGQMKCKLRSIEYEIFTAETKLEDAERKWATARKHEILLEKIEQRSRAGHNRLQSSLDSEEKRGSKIYQDMYDQETAKVARAGVQGLICVDCNGFRWNDKKVNLSP